MADMCRKGRQAVGPKAGLRLWPDARAFGDRNGMRKHPEAKLTGDKHWTRCKPELVARGDRNGARVHIEKMARGESHPKARFTEADIREIRSRHDAGESLGKLRRKYQTGKSTIHNIVIRRTWKHVI
jgi:hypothetical protein